MKKFLLTTVAFVALGATGSALAADLSARAEKALLARMIGEMRNAGVRLVESTEIA